MKKTLIYTLLYFSLSIAQNNTAIKGYVYDSDGSPISNAEVYISSLSDGSVTDTSGYFEITNSLLLKEEVNYFITVSHIGYISKNIKISSLDNINIYLNRKLLNADQVVVSALGYKSYIKDTPVITHIITEQDIYNSPYNSASDIIEFVMPNVQRIHDPHGVDDKLKIQGLDNRFVVFMIDGNRISGEFAGNIDLSIINIEDIQKIEIIRSGMSTLYGSDSMGGLINIITKKNINPFSIEGSYSHDLPASQSLSMKMGAQFYNFNYKINLSYNNSPGYDLTNYSPLSKTVEENLNYKVNNSLSYEWKDIMFNYVNQYYVKEVNLYNYRAVYESEGIPIVKDGLLSDKDNSRYTDYINNFSIRYNDFKFNISKELYNKSFYYPYYYNSYPQNKDGETLISSKPMRYDFSLSLKSSIVNHLFLFGMQYARETYQSYDVFSKDGTEILNPSIFSDNKERVINETSFFITDQFKIFNGETVLGLRATKYFCYNWNFIPSISLRYEFYGQNLRFNYSRGYRVPSLKELYYNFPEHPMQPLYGNPDLRPSMSDYYAISIESIKSLNSSIEIYLNNVIDMISPISTSNNIMEYSNTKKVSLYGFNINFDIPIYDKITIKSVLSYTNGDSNDRRLIEGISRYSFNTRLKYNISSKSNLLFTTKYNSSKNVFVYSNNSSGYFYKLDSYSISDILLSYKLGKISIKGGIKNIFDYLSPSRNNNQAGENLSTIDPGRRIYFSMNFSI